MEIPFYAGVGEATRLVLGGELEDRRQLTAEQRLLGAVLDSMLADLARRPSCGRYQVALAWVRGSWPCGCPYESSLEFEYVADALREEPERLRARAVAFASRATPSLRDDRPGACGEE